MDVIKTNNIWLSIESQPWLIELPVDNKKWLRYRERYCNTTLSANQSIPDATNTIVLFDTFYTSDFRMKAQPTIADGRMTVKFPWFYSLTWNICFEESATGIRQVVLLINGAVTIPNPNTNQIQVIPGFTWWPYAINTITGSIWANLQYDDYVQIQVYQDSGGALDIDKIATSFRIYWTQ